MIYDGKSGVARGSQEDSERIWRSYRELLESRGVTGSPRESRGVTGTQGGSCKHVIKVVS